MANDIKSNGVGLTTLYISSEEQHLFIDDIGRFYYYIEYFHLGDYSGHDTKYVSFSDDATTYHYSYSFMGWPNIIEMYHRKDDPSDPSLMELDVW